MSETAFSVCFPFQVATVQQGYGLHRVEGWAVQVDSIKARFESAYAFNA